MSIRRLWLIPCLALFALQLGAKSSGCGGGGGGGSDAVESTTDTGTMGGGDDDAGEKTFDLDYASLSDAGQGLCAVTTGGRIVCHGVTQLKAGAVLVSEASHFTQVSEEAPFVCGVTESQSVECWQYGAMAFEQLPSGSYQEVSAGSAGICALTTSGTVECVGPKNEETKFEKPPSTKAQQVAVSSNGSFACLLGRDGNVECWGDDIPATEPPATTFKQISVGMAHGCGITEGGSVECWGEGQTKEDDRENAFEQGVAPSGAFAQVEAGALHTCGLTSSGEAKCWGLGTNPDETEGGAATFADHDQANPPDGTFQDVAAGVTVSWGLKGSGEIVSWGEQDRPDQTDKPLPAQVTCTRQHEEGYWICP